MIVIIKTSSHKIAILCTEEGERHSYVFTMVIVIFFVVSSQITITAERDKKGPMIASYFTNGWTSKAVQFSICILRDTEYTINIYNN